MKGYVGKTLVLAIAFLLPAAVLAANGNKKTVYIAHLQPMNTQVTGQDTTGLAKLTVNDDTLMIRISVQNAPPGIVHWQHFHGFSNGQTAHCPSASADSNGDGIVDLIETHSASGKTMVPFDSDPAAMDVAHGEYPKASSDGSYTYKEKISLSALKKAFAKAYDGQELHLDRRVIYIHGVPSDTRLPPSVASLGPIPAHVTLPIACGEIQRAK
jgi:hypothetical protein